MQGLEDHCFRFTSDKLFNGLPAQLIDKWSARGVKAAVGYTSFFYKKLVYKKLVLRWPKS